MYSNRLKEMVDALTEFYEKFGDVPVMLENGNPVPYDFELGAIVFKEK